MTETTAEGGRTVGRAAVVGWVQSRGVYAALALLIVFNVAFTSNFVRAATLTTQLVQVAPVVVVALGMALVIGTEGVDLSVGAVMALAAALLPLYLGYGPAVAIVVAVVAGMLCGLLNGTLVAVAGVQPIVATLALLVGGRGLALVLANGQSKDITDATVLGLGANKVVGVPDVVIVAGVLALAVGLLVRRTIIGRHLLAVGGNRRAAELAGLPVRRVLITVYVLSGALAAVAGLLATARLTSSDPSSVGLLIELSAITAVVVGGTPLSGGRVRILGTVTGALLMQLISSTLIRHNLYDSTTRIVEAGIIVVAVLLQRGRGAV